MLRKTLCTLAALAMMTVAGTSHAAEVLVEMDMDSRVLSTTNWDEVLTVNKYSNTSGALSKVVVTLEGSVQGDAAYESLDAGPTTVTLNLSANISLARPSGGAQIIDITPLDSVSENAGAFDGTIDFAGTSGTSFNGLSDDDIDTITLTSPADLALFTGPGTIDLDANATGISVGSGAGNLLTQFGTSASAKVTVEYYVDTGNEIPEPASFAVFGLAGLALVRRRSRA